MKKIIITGCLGMLGTVLVEALKEQYDLYGFDKLPDNASVPHYWQIDLTDREQVKEKLAEIKPDCIIHCAAITSVPYCEEMSDEARAVNTGATENIARVSTPAMRLIHISTAAVFDGQKGKYGEGDCPAPINVYAQTKLGAESAVAKYSLNHVIVRTDIIGWKRGQYMVQGLYESLAGSKEVNGYTDAIFNPISVNSMANCLAKLLTIDYCGILHIGSLDQVSKYDFSLKFARAFGFNESLVKKELQGDSAGVRRPKNTSLNVSKASKLFNGLKTVDQEISIISQSRRRNNEV